MLSALVVVAALHAVIAVPAGIAAAYGAIPIKSAKFALSIAILLGTLVPILRAMTIEPRTRWILETILAVTMVVEMTAILGQAIRGTESHFNTRTAFDALVWHAMALAIVTAYAALVAVAILASIRPLDVDPAIAFAVRVGLWLVLLVAVSGFAMGGRGSHGPEPRGDLRVPHFFALHALQVLPAVAIVATRLPIGEGARWSAVAIASLGWAAICVGTLARAFAYGLTAPSM